MPRFRTFTAAELREQREYDDARNAAAEEGAIAFGHAEQVCAMLDRHAGDWGADPDMIADLGRRLEALHGEIVATLGQPKRAVYRDGVLVALMPAGRL